MAALDLRTEFIKDADVDSENFNCFNVHCPRCQSKVFTSKCALFEASVTGVFFTLFF